VGATRLKRKHTSVRLMYKSSEQNILGTNLGAAPVTIVSALQFERVTASTLVEWTRFLLMSSWTWVVPFVVWRTSRTMYLEHVKGLSSN